MRRRLRCLGMIRRGGMAHCYLLRVPPDAPTERGGYSSLAERNVYEMAKRLLNNASAKALVFAGQQLLGEIVAASVRIAGDSGEMMVDPHSGRAAEVSRDR
jgi:hypothetical protein